jgi:hypothetical protein
MKRIFTPAIIILFGLMLISQNIQAATDTLSCTIFNYQTASAGCDVYVIYTGNAPSSATYHWHFGGGVIVSGSGPGPYYIRWDTVGYKTITLTVNYNSDSCYAANWIHIVPTPTVYNVTGGGSYPSGGSGVHIYLSGSQTNYTYSLYLNNGSSSVASATGTGSQIDFGLFTAAGVYKAKAKVDSSSISCLVNMADSAIVTISGYVPSQAICVVSYDTTHQKNKITYYKTAGQHLSHYNIYRETYEYNIFTKIGEVPYLNPNYYIDTTSYPLIMSYKYYITGTDTLGNESQPSPYHTSVHLEVSPGVFGFNLIWNAYQGCTYLFCRIHRKISNGPWETIDSVASDIISYTDPYFSSEEAYYFIEVVRYYTCQTFKSTDEDIFTSNIGYSKPLGIVENTDNHILVYPNPAKQTLHILLPKSTGIYKLGIYSVDGNKLGEMNLALPENILDISNLPSGLYFVRISGDQAVSVMKILKE